MAISATLELRDSNSVASKVKGSLVDSYIVVDLDYTLKRSIDKTGRPSSVAIIDVLTVTIKASKELKTPFHNWINKPDELKNGIIKIFDSTGFVSSAVQDVTGSSAGVDYGMVNDWVTEEIEGNMNYAMDEASKYGDHDDIFEEMDRSELLDYIASKNLDVKTDSGDSDETIRKRIRYYNEISKMSLAELQKEARAKNVSPAVGDTDEPTEIDYIRALVEYNNKQSASQTDAFEQPTYKAADQAKRAASQTASSVANAVVRVLESARSITFENAYCVSLREHFKATSNNQSAFDASYPWTLEIGIKPSKVTVSGANVGGSTSSVLEDVVFDFFTV